MAYVGKDANFFLSFTFFLFVLLLTFTFWFQWWWWWWCLWQMYILPFHQKIFRVHILFLIKGHKQTNEGYFSLIDFFFENDQFSLWVLSLYFEQMSPFTKQFLDKNWKRKCQYRLLLLCNHVKFSRFVSFTKVSTNFDHRNMIILQVFRCSLNENDDDDLVQFSFFFELIEIHWSMHQCLSIG